MNKFMNFNETVKNAFDNDSTNYMAFNKLLVDTYNDKLIDLTKDEANAKIVEIFRKTIGCDETSSTAEIRKAIRRNQVQIYEILEEVIPDLLISGWNDNPFFRECVDVRNLALGDKNEFYVEDNSVLTVTKVSGNHHDLIRQRLGSGKSFTVSTEWYGIKD